MSNNLPGGAGCCWSIDRFEWQGPRELYSPNCAVWLLARFEEARKFLAQSRAARQTRHGSFTKYRPLEKEGSR